MYYIIVYMGFPIYTSFNKDAVEARANLLAQAHYGEYRHVEDNNGATMYFGMHEPKGIDDKLFIVPITVGADNNYLDQLKYAKAHKGHEHMRG